MLKKLSGEKKKKSQYGGRVRYVSKYCRRKIGKLHLVYITQDFPSQDKVSEFQSNYIGNLWNALRSDIT